MFFVLVKFKGEPIPRLFGTTHMSDCYVLATMDGVEWVSHTITGKGYVLPRKEYIGKSLIGEDKIVPILPEDGHHFLTERATMTKGMRPVEEDALNRVRRSAFDNTNEADAYSAAQDAQDAKDAQRPWRVGDDEGDPAVLPYES
jgi:hypothetical protein